MAFQRSGSGSKSPEQESKGELGFHSAEQSSFEVGSRNTPLITDPGGKFMEAGDDSRNAKMMLALSPSMLKISDEDRVPHFLRRALENSQDFSSSRKISLDESMDSYQGRRKGLQRHKKKHNVDSDRSAGRWRKEEHAKFIQGLKMYGRDWKKVEGFLGTRTGAQIRSHAQKFFNRIQREFGVSDPGQFVASGEFERRLAQGHVPHSAQDSSLLNFPPSYNDSTVNSGMSPRQLGVSSFQRSSVEHTPESSKRNTPSQNVSSNRRLLKRELREEQKSEKSASKAIKMSQTPSIIILDNPSMMANPSSKEELRSLYEEMVTCRAGIISEVQRDTSSALADLNIFLTRAKYFYQKMVVPCKEANQSLEVQLMKTKVEECLRELEDLRDRLTQRGSVCITVEPAAQSYFDNVILPSLGCKDAMELNQKYPRVHDWADVIFSQPE